MKTFKKITISAIVSFICITTTLTKAEESQQNGETPKPEEVIKPDIEVKVTKTKDFPNLKNSALPTCQACGMKLGSMGKPYPHKYSMKQGEEVIERQIYLCSKVCVRPFNEKTSQFHEKIEEELSKLIKNYGTDIDVVTDEKLTKYGVPAKYTFQMEDGSKKEILLSKNEHVFKLIKNKDFYLNKLEQLRKNPK